MNFWKGMLFLGGYLSTVTVEADAELLATAPHQVAAPKAVVTEFLREVRAGRRPERAGEFLAETVIAHQLNAEQPTDVERSPADYARHIEDFKRAYGAFDLDVTELIAEGDRVYARWRQTGCHIGSIEGYAPTRRPVVELASAVYRVVDGKIVEYWIQVDRWGTEAQLRAHRAEALSPAVCA